MKILLKIINKYLFIVLIIFFLFNIKLNNNNKN